MMSGRATVMLGWTLLAGCVHAGADRAPAFKFDTFEAHLVSGSISVLPAVVTSTEPELELGLFGGPVPVDVVDLRRDRVLQVRAIADLYGWAMPGALSVALAPCDFDPDWTVGKWPGLVAPRVASALRGRGAFVGRDYPTETPSQVVREDELDIEDGAPVTPSGGRRSLESLAFDTGVPESLDEALAGAARAGSGKSVLVTWVRGLTGEPLTSKFLVGEVTYVGDGPVVVTLEEPYRVTGRFGLALVSPQGEVLVRVEEPFEAVLGDHYGPGRIARDIARDLAEEVSRFWPVDPALVWDGAEDELAVR